MPPRPVAEKLTVVENDAMKVTFTSVGAAITEIELKQQKADNGGNIMLNEQSHTNVLALNGWPGADTASFTAQENPGQGVTYTAELPNGLKWQRTYAFRQEQPTNSGMSGLPAPCLPLGRAPARPDGRRSRWSTPSTSPTR